MPKCFVTVILTFCAGLFTCICISFIPNSLSKSFIIVTAPGVIFVQECVFLGGCGIAAPPQPLVVKGVDEDAPEFPAPSVQVTT